MTQQTFSMIPRARAATDDRCTAALQSSKEQSRHRLSAEDVNLMVDCAKFQSANMRRQTTRLGFVDDIGSCLPQRFDDPLHRTPAQKFVAIDTKFARGAGKEAHEDARGRR